MSYVMDPSHRQLGMETDVANPNFAGSRNPDDLLWVQFAVRPMQDNYQTELQKRPIFRDEIWIEIRIPGRNDLTIERPMENSDKIRFTRQWAFFERTHSADGQNVGTPLTQWPLLRPSQIEELRALRFSTVEQIALSSDETLQRIGMAGGMSPLALRDKAKQYLDSAHTNAVVAQNDAEKKALADALQEERRLREESDRKHEADMEEMKALLQTLAKAQQPKGKGGRPRKSQEQPPPGE